MGLVVTVPRLIVKLTPFEIAEIRGPVGVSAVVLQVTLRRAPAEAVCVISMSLLVCAAEVLTVQVAPEAFVAQENAPDEAEEHVATDGLADVPTPEQFVALAYLAKLAVPELAVRPPPLMVMPPLLPILMTLAAPLTWNRSKSPVYPDGALNPISVPAVFQSVGAEPLFT